MSYKPSMGVDQLCCPLKALGLDRLVVDLQGRQPNFVPSQGALYGPENPLPCRVRRESGLCRHVIMLRPAVRHLLS